MPTITELTEKYISQHPSIKDCLRSGVVNYSKLARKIAKDLGIKVNMEAILIACRRFSEKLKKEEAMEERVMDIVRRSELVIRNKIAVVIVEKRVYAENLRRIERKIREKADTFYAVESTDAITIIVSERYVDELKSMFQRNIITLTKDLALLTIKSPKVLEKTPGVAAYLFSLFSENGVNIVEAMSCWTDTIFAVKEDDVAAVMKFLKI